MYFLHLAALLHISERKAQHIFVLTSKAWWYRSVSCRLVHVACLMARVCVAPFRCCVVGYVQQSSVSVMSYQAAKYAISVQQRDYATHTHASRHRNTHKVDVGRERRRHLALSRTLC